MPNEIPKCPKCGATMILQTARRGRFVGHNFYGCPNWRTTCKGVCINIDEGSTSTEVTDTGMSKMRQPIILNARERFQGYRAWFFQNMAVPKELLDLMNQEVISRDDLYGYGQWRMDIPAINTFEPEENIKRVLLVAMKILTRGMVSILSPSLEKELRQLFLEPNKDFDYEDVDPKSYYAINKTEHKTNAWFDGKTKIGELTVEHHFYEKVLSKYLGDYYKRFVLPQVEFSSLVEPIDGQNNVGGYQRPDFLITTPTKSIVVELDGTDHDAHQSRDDERGRALQQSGFSTIRIGNQEIIDNQGDKLKELTDILQEISVKDIKKISETDKYLLAVKLANQIQITIVKSLLAGMISIADNKSDIYFDMDSVCFEQKEIETIAKSVIKDLNELLKNLWLLYNIKPEFKGLNLKTAKDLESMSAPIITFNENLVTRGVKIVIQDISFPNIIAHQEEGTTSTLVDDVSEDTLLFFLNYIFRYPSFLEGQFETIKRTLQGKDSVVLLPTSGGKSLAFQLASLVSVGVTIIIDPTTALIEDQIDNLFRIGIDRVVGITSMVERSLKPKLMESFAKGEYIFCYIAPQRLQIQQFRDKIVALTTSTPISIIAIDEAHCVSEWGHNFMTAYLNIGRIARKYCKADGRTPPLLALTGTASSAVLKDVQRELQIKFEDIITPKTFDRTELHFSVFECLSAEKQNRLGAILQGDLPNRAIFNGMSFYKSFNDLYHIESGEANCGLIFCLNAGGDYGVNKVQEFVSTLNIDSRVYSGKNPYGNTPGEEWNKNKSKNASNFKNNEFPIMVATKSFGMGIDKPNIRYVIHFGLPSSIESFYQEVGRAGRDKKNAQSILMFSNDFRDRTRRILDPNTTVEELNRILIEECNWNNGDDITRAVYLHLLSFRGVEEEMKSIEEVQNKLGNLEIANKVFIKFSNNNREGYEKAIHRLLVLGVICDYTIDYGSDEFCVTITGTSKNGVVESFCKYIEGYNRGRVSLERAKLALYENLPFLEFIRNAAEILISFIYETIEKGRRRAFSELLSMAEKAFASKSNEDELIRKAVLDYLQTTHSEEIKDILNEVGTFDNLKRIFDGQVESNTGEMIGGIKSPRDAAEIRGQVSRELESSPDHPGLLLLRALSELYCKEYNLETAFQNLKAAYHSALGKYNISETILHEVLSWMLYRISNINQGVYEEYISRLIEVVDDSNFLKTLINYPNMNDEMLYAPLLYSMSKQAKKAINILKS